MPPKNKGKKAKKGDDDEYWASVGETIPPAAGSSNLASLDDEGPTLKGSSGGGFAALMDEIDQAEEDQDFGGLMSTLKASKAKKGKEKEKKSKKKHAVTVSDDEEAAEGRDVAVSFADGQKPGTGDDGDPKGDISAPKQAREMTAEEIADEEFGPVKEKKKKDKKGKKGKEKAAKEDDEDEPEPKEAKKAEPVAAPSADKDGDDGGDDDEPADGEVKKVLSKKEKEKLKKERDKAKKKAAAAAAKAADPKPEPDAPAAAATPAPAPATGEDDDDDAEEGGAEGGASSKKKKKKKAAKKEEPAPAAATAGKKKGGAMSALKAMVEERKRLEEEARQREEEERRRIEEEEARIAEEERLKEEAKQKKKEKEKAKKELAKKEGRFLTKKQKEEQAAAEIRRKAFEASGYQIEGLVQKKDGDSSAPAKKMVYGSRKKKPGAGPAAAAAAVAAQSTASPAVSDAKLPAEEVKDDWDASDKEDKATPADVKDDWDASSDEEKPAAAGPSGVKDDWDASSEEEAAKAPATPEKKAAPAPAKGAPAKGQPAKKPEPAKKAEPAKATGATKPAPPAKGAPAAAKKPAAAAEELSSEEEESDDGSGSGSDSSEEDSDSDDSDDDSDSSEEMTATQRQAAQRKKEAAERRKKRMEEAMAARNKDDLRSPICCILGHVDTGKTKLLDKIRQTNVQEGEAGGITQQIGATYFPVEAIKQKTQVMNRDGMQEYKIPGLLIIDTPGHESFTNLRTRGSSLCNIAILVVDIMHGLEPQTLESLRLLRDRKTPFIVALNKIDRMYGWEATPDGAFRESLAKQKPSVQKEFAHRTQETITAFAEQGLNAVLYYDNKNFRSNVSLVPTSAITGEGVPDMISLLVNLTQTRMSERLMYLSELECTVLEVKVIEGLGTTIDVVLSNGILREGDKIVLCGLNGPIVTQVRALLTPQPLRELRIKSAYVHHKEVKAALGVKITAPDLEKAIAGSRLLVCGPDDDEDELRDEVMSDLTSLENAIDKSGRGVCVQASTLGSLEALLEFLRTSKIPVSGINIGPVHKKDVMRAATMLEKAKELSVILCFDVAVDKEAEKLAEELGIKIFKADIIYHLFDAFTAYNAEILEAKRRDAAPQAIWPCRLKILMCFAKRDPIVLGVDIIDGSLRVGTPLCVVKVDPATGKKDIIPLGKITSLEINHKPLEIVKKAQAGAGVAVKIEHAAYQSAKMFGRHFDEKDEVLSHISRQSIDVMKEAFKADVSTAEWQLIKGLKTRLNIP